MQNSSNRKATKSLLLTLFFLGLVTSLFLVPTQFQTEAVSTGEGLFQRTTSEDPARPNFDIRGEKSDEVADALIRYRESVGKTASVIAETKENFVSGEESLRSHVPTLKVEYNPLSNTPEVIAPDVWQAPTTLAGASGGKNADTLRNFIKQNNSLIGVDDAQADRLKVTADYTNPDGNLSFAHLEQFINDVPVFAGEIKAGFNKHGDMFKVINNLAAGLDYNSLSKDFGDPVNAVQAAFTKVGRPMTAADTSRNDAASTDLKVVYGTGDWATTAEKMYFPIEAGVAVPAWRVMIWEPVTAYYVIIDAHSGEMLWRKNLGNDQATTATYEVYRAPTSFSGVAGNPAPLSPGPVDPTAGTQGTLIARTNLTVIGNEAPNPGMNNLGWMTDATNLTDGNNVEAGLDLVAPNGVDPGSQATGTPNRVLTSLWNPPPGNPGPGDAPTVAEARRGAVIQMFYAMNVYHDVLYSVGFTEPARNFQNDNFGRGGNALDRVSAEGQDSSGTNNANFSAGADGTRGRMQMFVWTGPSPQRDGTGDAEVIFHEVTHGTSQRLHNNNAGLTTNMSGGMGEGWSDFYGHVLLSRPSEPLDSINTTGGYVLLNGFGVVGTANYYYGIRRFPKARMSFTGGPMNRPHNPMTFADIDSTQINVTNGAFAAMAGPHISTTADQVHAAGEIWSSALWEVRCLLVGRLGFANGSTKTLQYVTDGMKLDPIGPTFLQARDSIIQAAVNGADPASVVDIREGFRIRGMGFSASIQQASPARVTEAFDQPNVVMTDPFSVSDSPGDNDGFPEPGENVLLSVAVTNNTGATVNNVTANVTGGGSANYGNIAHGATVTRDLTYTVPGGAACGSLHPVTINVSSDVGPQTPQVRSFRLGVPVGGAPVTFTNNTALVIPGTGTGPGPSAPYGTTISASGLTGNKIVKLELTGWSHTFPGDLDFLLVGPAGQKFIPMSDTGNTTDVINGTTVLVDTAAAALPSGDGPTTGTFRPTDVTAGDTFAAPAPAAPYLSPAPVGTATFASAFGTDGATMNGTWTLYVMDDAGVDVGEMDGWKLTFEANDYACSVGGSVRSRADFDGDGRTDLSVFRPSEGNWYLNQSTAGFGVIKWGVNGDTLVPGDYDGDNKTDTAVFRPNADATQPDYFILRSNGFTVAGVSWGLSADQPLVGGDYDNDGKTDVAVYRPSNNTFYILNSGGGIQVKQYGVSGDVPIAGDYVGSTATDIAILRPSTNTYWIFNGSGDTVVSFGATGDVPVPADYNNDNKTDIAVYRPSTGQWIYQPSGGGATVFRTWGTSTDTPVPGDYDGDGSDDIAIYRPTTGQWWVNRSTAGVLVQTFGLPTDIAVPRRYLP